MKTSEGNFPLFPGITISDETRSTLPLGQFDALVIVEPDPETWMTDPRDDDQAEPVWGTICEFIDRELGWGMDDDEEEQLNDIDASIPLVDDQKLIWVRNWEDNYFDFCLALEMSTVEFVYRSGGSEVPEELRLYLQAAAQKYPHWRVAVMGGIFEDEVIRVASAVWEAGFQTTIVTRYCMSAKGFINLDDLAQYDSYIKTAGLDFLNRSSDPKEKN